MVRVLKIETSRLGAS